MMKPVQAQGTLLTGAVAIVIGVVLIGLPLVIPLASIGKYVIAAAFLAVCFGLCCLLMGAIDWFRSRS